MSGVPIANEKLLGTTRCQGPTKRQPANISEDIQIPSDSKVTFLVLDISFLIKFPRCS